MSTLQNKIKSGSITTQNLTPAGVATAGSAVSLRAASYSTATIQITGTYTGILSIQASIDGITWVTMGGTPLINMATAVGTATIASATNGIFQLDISGMTAIRVTALGAVTGSAVVTISIDCTTSVVSVDNIVSISQATAASLQSTSTPTAAATAISLNSAATTNATLTKATPGSLFEISASNMTASIKYLKLYNKATAPTVGTDVPIETIPIPANGLIELEFGVVGKRFTVGIGFAITGAQAIADTTAVAAGDVQVSGTYI